MRGGHAIVVILVALSIGYVVGIGYGRSDEADSWRRAVAATDEGCRCAVRDALVAGPFLRE